jgi:hypothetical protein
MVTGKEQVKCQLSHIYEDMRRISFYLSLYYLSYPKNIVESCTCKSKLHSNTPDRPNDTEYPYILFLY